MAMRSAMRVFHAWIDDHDHGGPDANTLYEIDGVNHAAAVFFDYGHSLLHEWRPPAAAPARDWPNLGDLDRAEMSRAVEQIETFPVEMLRSIITRLPQECLAQAARATLADALDQRRTELRRIFAL